MIGWNRGWNMCVCVMRFPKVSEQRLVLVHAVAYIQHRLYVCMRSSDPKFSNMLRV